MREGETEDELPRFHITCHDLEAGSHSRGEEDAVTPTTYLGVAVRAGMGVRLLGESGTLGPQRILKVHSEQYMCMDRRVLNPPKGFQHAFGSGWVPNWADRERLWAGTMSNDRMDVIIQRAWANRQKHAVKGKEFLPLDDLARMGEAWSEWEIDHATRTKWMKQIRKAFSGALKEMDRKGG